MNESRTLHIWMRHELCIFMCVRWRVHVICACETTRLSHMCDCTCVNAHMNKSRTLHIWMSHELCIFMCVRRRVFHTCVIAHVRMHIWMSHELYIYEWVTNFTCKNESWTPHTTESCMEYNPGVWDDACVSHELHMCEWTYESVTNSTFKCEREQ